MQFPKTFEIDGFKVTLYATETDKWGEHNINLKIDGEFCGNYLRPWGLAMSADLARELVNEFFGN